MSLDFLTKRGAPALDKLGLHHFVPGHLASLVHGHAAQDRCQGTFGAPDSRVLRFAVTDALDERGHRVDRDVPRRLLHRLLLRTTKMAPVILRRFDHSGWTEELLDDIPISVGRKR